MLLYSKNILKRSLFILAINYVYASDQVPPIEGSPTSEVLAYKALLLEDFGDRPQPSHLETLKRPIDDNKKAAINAKYMKTRPFTPLDLLGIEANRANSFSIMENRMENRAESHPLRRANTSPLTPTGGLEFK